MDLLSHHKSRCSTPNQNIIRGFVNTVESDFILEGKVSFYAEYLCDYTGSWAGGGGGVRGVRTNPPLGAEVRLGKTNSQYVQQVVVTLE